YDYMLEAYIDYSCQLLFFFFQAEDGIRDGHVTGVQTCALPICHEEPHEGERVADLGARPVKLGDGVERPGAGQHLVCDLPQEERSEERRVGKECRSRWAPDD